MIRVFSAPTSVPVDALRAELDAEGIQCLVRNRDLSMTAGEVPPIETWPSLWVLDDRQREAAEAIVARFIADTGEPAPSWRCERCGEEIDGRFAACWRCDTSGGESMLAEPTTAAVTRDYAQLGDRARPLLRWLMLVGLLAAVMLLLAGLLSHARAGPADVLRATATCDAARRCRFDVTVRHDDTGWDHYANRWEVIGADGTILATRVLRHPHVDEQPFTRSLDGVVIPSGVERVRVRARDSVHGWGGAEATVELPSPPPHER